MAEGGDAEGGVTPSPTLPRSAGEGEISALRPALVTGTGHPLSRGAGEG